MTAPAAIKPVELRRWSAGVAVFLYPLAFILLPLVAFLAYSFFWTEHGQMTYALTLGNYQRFFTDPIFLPVLWQTCVLCLEVACLTVLAGYPVAYFLAGLQGRKRYILLMLMLVPLLMSYVIKIYAIRSILGGNGMLNRALLWLGVIDQPLTIFVFNLNAVLLTLTVLLIPFAVLPIFLSLERIPRSLMDASADLGASATQTFLRVILPLEPARRHHGAYLRLRAGDRRLPDAADGGWAERLHLRPRSSTASSARPSTGRSVRPCR